VSVEQRVSPAAHQLQIAIPDRLPLARIALVAVVALVILTRFVRLGTPDVFYFDETYFPRTAQEIYRGDPAAWEFFGHENTHPPLSKLFMAGGILTFEIADSVAPPLVPGSGGVDNSWAWRFPGALASVGAVIFIYLLARRLFNSEVAGLAAGFLLTLDGLAFAQSRIATPDTYVLFFTLGAVYFLVTNRFPLSGIMFGAAVACKWNAALTGVPIVLYFAWLLFSRPPRADSERLRPADILVPVGMMLIYLGGVLQLYSFISTHPSEGWSVLTGLSGKLGMATLVFGAVWFCLGFAMLFFGTAGARALTTRGRHWTDLAVAFAVFFVIVPACIYALTYVPLLANWSSVETPHPSLLDRINHAVDLNRFAFDFHSSLDQPHSSSSPWNLWPIMTRPIYFYVGQGGEKIYSLGNPLIFWFALPALAFALWRAFRLVRARFESATAFLSVRGSLPPQEAALLLVVLAYLGLWLPFAFQSRVLFIYHYLPALSFAILALAYAVHWLWQREEPLARGVAIAFLGSVGLMFAYFYPHLAAVDVPGWLEDTYYWDALPTGPFNWR